MGKRSMTDLPLILLLLLLLPLLMLVAWITLVNICLGCCYDMSLLLLLLELASSFETQRNFSVRLS